MSSVITPEELYRDHHDKVERYISSHIKNEQDRADVLHQVFLNAIAALDSYDPSRAAIGTWLYAITRNEVISYYRRLAREPIPADSEELSLFPAQNDSEKLSGDMLDALAAALEQLPKRERDIIVFRFYHGLSAKETAERVGVSYANVRFLQHSALKKMRGYFEENGLL